jgi:hypothetical protein
MKNYPKKRIKTLKISLHSVTSSEAEEEKLKMWKELRQQMHPERELTKMLLNDLRQKLLEAQEENKIDQRPHRGHPYYRRTLSNRVQRLEFTEAANIARENNLSMLPRNKFIIDNLKKDTTSKEGPLKHNY